MAFERRQERLVGNAEFNMALLAKYKCDMGVFSGTAMKIWNV